MYRYALFIALATLTGCKILVTSPPEGAVASYETGFYCPANSGCEIDVENAGFYGVFEGVPEPGFAFYRWQAGDSHYCGNSSAICNIYFGGASSGPQWEEAFASDYEMHLQPVFKPVRSTGQIDSGNALFHIERSVEITASLLPLGRIESRAIRDLALSGAVSISGFCPNGGNYKAKYNDKNGDGALGKGDVVIISLNFCQLPQSEGIAFGNVRVGINPEFALVGGDYSWRHADVSYGNGLWILRETGDITISGKHQLGYEQATPGMPTRMPSIEIDTDGERSMNITLGSAQPLEIDFEIGLDQAADWEWNGDYSTEFYEFDSEIRAFDEVGMTKTICAAYLYWDMPAEREIVGNLSHGTYQCTGSDNSRLLLDPMTEVVQVDADGDGEFETQTASDVFRSEKIRGFFGDHLNL